MPINVVIMMPRSIPPLILVMTRTEVMTRPARARITALSPRVQRVTEVAALLTMIPAFLRPMTAV